MACEALSAHLATITSIEEQGFIQSKMLPNSNHYNHYFIGGTGYGYTPYWTWITGEAWSYSYWAGGQPGFYYGNYLMMEDVDGGWYNVGDSYSSNTEIGYICEWSNNNTVGTAVVPDLNGNGVNEITALWVDYKTGKHTVQIKDPATNTILNTLTFATDFNPPQGLVVLNDLNGNGVPEIGVLYLSSAKLPTVQIKDAKNNAATVKTLGFLSQSYTPRAITVSPDSNGNGASEITVLGRNTTTGKDMAQQRDSKTGALLYTVGF